jgi:periplasmic divalent cation tolerance protein
MIGQSTTTTDARVIYVGVPTREEALTIGRTLVKERLAGAANVVPDVTSIFWWDGALHERSEATLILFTLAANLEAATARIQALHSYVVPGIKIWTISGGSEAWLAWLRAEARPAL